MKKEPIKMPTSLDSYTFIVIPAKAGIQNNFGVIASPSFIGMTLLNSNPLAIEQDK
jgi:hypothetical protein